MTAAFFAVVPVALGAFPVAFDAREQWPACVTPVRDAGDTQDGLGCASEWAMTATQTLQTNLCVLGKKTPVLSAEETGSCHEKLANLLCTNWVIETAWDYIAKHGVHTE